MAQRFSFWPWRRPPKRRLAGPAGQHVISAHQLRRKYGDAFDDIKTVFLGLDPARIQALLDDYAAQYGKGARRYAQTTYRKWQSGEVTMAGQTVTRLFDLLPRHMTEEEKLTLIKLLRRQTLQRLHRSSVRLTVARRSDMSAVIHHVVGLMRRVADIPLPEDFQEVQGWITLQNARALTLLAAENERFIAAQRLADLIVQMTTVARLAPLAASGWRLRVTSRFEIPTASVEVRFASSFWREGGYMAEENPAHESDQEFLVRLQELALRQEHQEGSLTFVEYVMRTLTPEEQEKLRAIAAAEGLRTEILLRELQVKTIAARGDIEATIATAERLKADRHHSKITSEHATASGTTKIEIENKPRPCYIATACYGDPNHPDVRTLRRFRDERLLSTLGGRALVRLYEACSPPLARRLGHSHRLSRPLRTRILEPLARRMRGR